MMMMSSFLTKKRFYCAQSVYYRLLLWMVRMETDRNLKSDFCFQVLKLCFHKFIYG